MSPVSIRACRKQELVLSQHFHAHFACRLCKGAVAGLSILMALLWSMTSRYGDALNFPSTYLSNALLPIFFCILSAYFVAELWAQVSNSSTSP